MNSSMTLLSLAKGLPEGGTFEKDIQVYSVARYGSQKIERRRNPLDCRHYLRQYPSKNTCSINQCGNRLSLISPRTLTGLHQGRASARGRDSLKPIDTSGALFHSSDTPKGSSKYINKAIKLLWGTWRFNAWHCMTWHTISTHAYRYKL